MSNNPVSFTDPSGGWSEQGPTYYVDGMEVSASMAGSIMRGMGGEINIETAGFSGGTSYSDILSPIGLDLKSVWKKEQIYDYAEVPKELQSTFGEMMMSSGVKATQVQIMSQGSPGIGGVNEHQFHQGFEIGHSVKGDNYFEGLGSRYTTKKEVFDLVVDLGAIGSERFLNVPNKIRNKLYYNLSKNTIIPATYKVLKEKLPKFAKGGKKYLGPIGTLSAGYDIGKDVINKDFKTSTLIDASLIGVTAVAVIIGSPAVIAGAVGVGVIWGVSTVFGLDEFIDKKLDLNQTMFGKFINRKDN